MEEGRLAGIDMAQRLGYLSEDRAIKAKKRVMESLCSLRSGPFGQACYRAKLNIIQTMRIDLGDKVLS